MEKKKISGKEVRYLLKQNSVNLSWLSEQLGISAQALQERLKAQEFKPAYLLEIVNVLGKDIFGIHGDDGNGLLKQPILDIRVCAGNGVGLEGNENKVDEYVSIPSMQGCIGLTVYGDSMTPKYCSGQTMKANRPIFNYAQVMSRHADDAIRRVIDYMKNPAVLTDDREKITNN